MNLRGIKKKKEKKKKRKEKKERRGAAKLSIAKVSLKESLSVHN